jgi:hypothetical protein
MLNGYEAKPVYPIWRNILLPIFFLDQLIVLGILLAVASVISIAAWDSSMLIFLCLLGYLAYVLSIQNFLPYEVEVQGAKLPQLVQLLDRTPILVRMDDELRWTRKSAMPRFLRSRLDEISICCDDDLCLVRGRNVDMKVLTRALNSRA